MMLLTCKHTETSAASWGWNTTGKSVTECGFPLGTECQLCERCYCKYCGNFCYLSHVCLQVTRAFHREGSRMRFTVRVRSICTHFHSVAEATSTLSAVLGSSEVSQFIPTQDLSWTSTVQLLFSRWSWKMGMREQQSAASSCSPNSLWDSVNKPWPPRQRLWWEISSCLVQQRCAAPWWARGDSGPEQDAESTRQCSPGTAVAELTKPKAAENPDLCIRHCSVYPQYLFQAHLAEDGQLCSADLQPAFARQPQ